MKNLLFGGFLSLVLLSTTTSCDPCVDCGPSRVEPEISVTFFNGDSLIQMRDSLVVVDTLVFAVDSLLIVVDSIENGGNLSEERAALENFIDDLTNLRSTKAANELAECLDSLGMILTDQVALLESGSTALDVLSHISTGYLLEGLDSAEIHYLALDLKGTESQYQVQIDGDQFHINIFYDQVDELDEDRNLIRMAFLRQITSDFDSLFCICAEVDTVDISTIDCLASETTIHAYF